MAIPSQVSERLFHYVGYFLLHYLTFLRKMRRYCCGTVIIGMVDRLLLPLGLPLLLVLRLCATVVAELLNILAPSAAAAAATAAAVTAAAVV
ncbi:unnamed protein product [Ceratitis capitata]|uniref:(Mediterranean fruit fly) hypothetical protein n=1 Tax=Ceratitis capitata TaxID=7213 RepID=A0A811U095_CERCA|nr:unnamed protein product [Ceratitis capitata]